MHQSTWIVQGTAGNAAIDTTFLGTAAPSPPWRRWRLVELSATERAEVLARPVVPPPSCRDPHLPSSPLSIMIPQVLNGGAAVQFRPSALTAAAGCWDRETDRCCAGSIETSWTSGGRGEGEHADGTTFWALLDSVPRRCLRRAGGWSSCWIATRSAGG